MKVLLGDLTAVSPYFRLVNNIRNRIKAISWQASIQRDRTIEARKGQKALLRMTNCLLDIKYTNTKTWRYEIINRAFKSLGTREEHMVKIFGTYARPRRDKDVDILEQEMLRTLALTSKEQRVRELQTRILLEIIEKNYKGWFTVFNTLTVTNNHMIKVFEKDSRVFEKYILSINYAIKKEAELQDEKDYKKVSEYHSYFAVVEKGGETGRLHFHCLHFIKYCPRDCSDPNYGRSIPDHRIIAAFRTYWRWGFSAPIAVRYGAMDNFARAGWRWPVKRVAARHIPIEFSNPLRMARYMAKYILKSEKDIFSWRTRMTHGLGTKIIVQAVEKMTLKMLEQVMTIGIREHLTVMGICLPMGLTRKIAIKSYLRRKNSGSKNTRKSITQKSMMKIKPRPSIVERYRTLTQKRQKCSLQSTGSLKMRSSNRKDIFNMNEIFRTCLASYGYGRQEVEARGVTW